MSTNKMDFGNIIRQVYEPTSESLNVNLVGSGSPTLPSSVRLTDGTGYLSSTVGLGYRALDVSIKNIPEIVISHTDDSIRIGDGVNLATITQNGLKYGLDINIINNSLNVSDSNVLTELQNINNKIPVGLSIISSRLLVDGSGVIQPISASSLPLPTGAATESTLSTINNKLPSLGQSVMVSSIPVVIASNQSTIPVSVSSLPLPSGAATEATLTNINNKFNSLGQHNKAGSISVTLASDEGNIPISLADEPIKMSGTIDGQPNGTEYTFVNNLKQQILASHDRQMNISYADFGTKDQRVTQIDYSSSTFPGFTARKTLNYTLVGTRYKRNSINWTIV